MTTYALSFGLGPAGILLEILPTSRMGYWKGKPDSWERGQDWKPTEKVV